MKKTKKRAKTKRRSAQRNSPDRFSHWPANPTPGESLSITFTNPALANQTVTIALFSDETPIGTEDIVLDENGIGTIETSCPEGDVVTLTHSTSADHVIVTSV